MTEVGSNQSGAERTMSLFPRRVGPGDEIILHFRVNSKSPDASHFTAVQTWIEDPKGRRIANFVNGVFSWPDGGVNNIKAQRKVMRKMQALPPPILALPLFSEISKDRSDAIKFFATCLGSTHRYLTFRIPKNALEGKYLVWGNFISAKGSSRSSTLSSDHFFVERLRVLSVKKTKRGLQARVQNKSARSVPAQIIEVEATKGKTRTRPTIFRARRTSTIQLRSTEGFIRYGSAGKLIGIKADSTPYCIRDLSLDFADDPRRKVTQVWSPKHKFPLRLEGAKREIWLAASGVQTRRTIRTFERRPIYDSMLRTGLIHEINTFEDLDFQRP